MRCYCRSAAVQWLSFSSNTTQLSAALCRSGRQHTSRAGEGRPSSDPKSETTSTAPLHRDDVEGSHHGEMSVGRKAHLNSSYQRLHSRQQPREHFLERQRRSSSSSASTASRGKKPIMSTLAERRDVGDTREVEQEWEYMHTTSRIANVPMVYPGAKLPPLSQKTRRPKFSFLKDANDAAGSDFFVFKEVPNNTPKPLLPMWASSLTSPTLGKQRIVEENWISSDSMGVMDRERTEAFTAWLEQTVLPAGAPLATQLRTNVLVRLRRAFGKGVYARRAMKAGEVILTIPLYGVGAATEAPTAPKDNEADMSITSSSQDGPQELNRLLALNSDTLSRHSAAVRCRLVPDFESVQRLVSHPRSPLEPIPHPLFVDQIRLALMLACERAATREDGREEKGDPGSLAKGVLGPYLDILGSEELFDDDRVMELHRGVLDPVSYLEYRDHCGRFSHLLREVHKYWCASYEVAAAAAEMKEHMTDCKESDIERTEVQQKLPIDENGRVAPLLSPRSVRVPSVTSITAAPTLPIKNDEQRMVMTSVGGTGDERTSLPFSFVSLSLSTLRPPPSFEDVEWAFRMVLSRQRVLPGIRHARQRADFLKSCGSSSSEGAVCESQHALAGGGEEENLNALSRFIMKGKWAVYKYLFRAVDEERLHVNEFDPTDVATVVPLLDMMYHPPSGVANTTYELVWLPTHTAGGGGRESDNTTKESKEGLCEAGGTESEVTIHNVAQMPNESAPSTQHTASESGGNGDLMPHIVLRASANIDECDELTLLHPKCYSVAYTLYRFGCLPLRIREEDATEVLELNRVDGNLKAVYTEHS